MKQSKIDYAVYFLFLLIIVSCGDSQLTDYRPKAPQAVPQQAFHFTSGDLKLGNGVFKESQDAEGRYMLKLNEDRLLAPFLIESGLPPKDSIYEGWETDVLPGVALSFYLSGMSRMYMTTGNKEYLDRINYALDELEKCQKKTGGYLLGTRGGRAIFERLKKEGCFPEFGEWGEGHATPFYSLEKLMSGLRDIYRVCHIRKALTVWEGIGDWLSDLMARIPDTELQKIMTTEYGGMNWLLADLYADTNDKRYLAMSKRWQDSITVVPCVNGKDPLTDVHANTQFPKFSGLAARYPYSGDKGDLEGARFFWEQVVYHRSYATGGNSESEYFPHADSLSDKLTPFTEENCNEYNMLRLTSLLYEVSPKAEYCDFQERILYNHSLAAQNPADSKICYFLPLMSGARRKYSPLYNDFTCCVCSSMDHYTRHGELIYAWNDSTLYVNEFIASKLTWKNKNVNVSQETSFPFSDRTLLRFHCNGEIFFDLKIRNPYWLAAPMEISVTGQKQVAAPSNGYLHIARTWRDGDVVSIRLPMKLRTESMHDDKNKVALFYGPVLLAGALDETQATGLAENMLNPALLAEEKPVEQWLKPVGDSLQFICSVSKPWQLKVKPLFLLKTGFYTVYWQKMTDKEFALRQDRISKDKKDKIIQERRTVDEVVVGDSVSEKNHHLAGHSDTGSWPVNLPSMAKTGTWRMMSGTDGFGYTMKLPQDGNAVLRLKFLGRQSHEYWNFAIIAGGDTVLTRLRDKDDRYPVIPLTMECPLPKSLTEGRDSVTLHIVRFKSEYPRTMPRLLGLSVSRE